MTFGFPKVTVTNHSGRRPKKVKILVVPPEIEQAISNNFVEVHNPGHSNAETELEEHEPGPISSSRG